jgi:hypothetical protein
MALSASSDFDRLATVAVAVAVAGTSVGVPVRRRWAGADVPGAKKK